jgi:selenocysteine lyase/cysteine desulfurase
VVQNVLQSAKRIHPRRHDQRLSYDDFRLCIDGKASGAVRISVGLVSNFEDAQKFLEFARGLLK